MIVVFGASGAVGRNVVALLRQKGQSVREVRRKPNAKPDNVVADLLDPNSLPAALDGATAVISCAGASVSMRTKGRTSFADIDLIGHLNLAAAMGKMGMGSREPATMVYLSVHTTPDYAETQYAQAHAMAEDAFARNGIALRAVRSVGIFSALTELVDFARKGFCPLIGSGEARTNPIHPRDVAEECIAALTRPPGSISIGGPEIFSRREIALLAFAAVEKKPRLVPVFTPLMRLSDKLIRPLHNRLGDLLEVFAEVSTHDSIAPAVGKRKLLDYFQAHAALAAADRQQ